MFSNVLVRSRVVIAPVRCNRTAGGRREADAGHRRCGGALPEDIATGQEPVERLGCYLCVLAFVVRVVSVS